MSDTRIRFDRSDLQTELRRRIDEYFETTGKSRDGRARIILKAGFLFAWFAASYLTFILLHPGAPLNALLGISAGLAAAGIGFCIQHDGGHGAFSRKPWVNRAAAMSLDFLGGSSYVWRHKHGFLHHTYPNITDVDPDIRLEPFARTHANIPHKPHFRYQHLYIWVLYSILAITWTFHDDFRRIYGNKLGDQPVKRPRGWDLVVLFGGKALHFSYALIIPIALLGWGQALPFYFGLQLTLGLTLSMVFQLAHCVEEAGFVNPPGEDEELRLDYARAQLATAVDFGRDNRLLSWYVGGLDFQAIHHLFPSICHLHYPALAPIVAETCAEFGVPYRTMPSFSYAVRSHYRFLKRMGQEDGANASAGDILARPRASAFSTS